MQGVSMSPTEGAICPVIMAGGGGTRLWPLSRSGHPKQFLALSGGERTLFQDSLLRLDGLARHGWRLAPPVVITNEEYRFMVLDQLAAIGCGAGAVVLEPMGRNTAPALTLAALHGVQAGADPVLVICPSDHGV